MDESKIQKVPQKLEEQEIDLIELAQKVTSVEYAL